MKHFLIAAAVVAASSVTLPASATDVGVSISVGQPGFYGRIDVGNYPPPQVIYRQPILVGPMPVNRQPVYLRVPPGHAKNWRKHCHEYNACNEQVYFVQDNWYNREYVPRYEERHRNSRDERRGNSGNNPGNESRDEGRGNSGGGNRGNQKNEHRGGGRD